MKLRILPSFYILAFLSIALGYTEQFFMLFMLVTLHELAHIATALLLSRFRKRNVCLLGIAVSPLGETAVFSGLFELHTLDKVLISSAGPAVSFLIAKIAYSSGLSQLFIMNLSIALVNCLPVFPLDGGRILYSILSDFIGCMNASKVVGKIGRVVSVLCFAAGMIQVVLYPYNVTLVCISQFIKTLSTRESTERMIEVYNAVILNEKDVCGKHRRRKRTIQLREDDEIISAFNSLNTKSEILVRTEKRIISEEDLIKHIRERGLIGNIYSISSTLIT